MPPAPHEHAYKVSRHDCGGEGITPPVTVTAHQAEVSPIGVLIFRNAAGEIIAAYAPPEWASFTRYEKVTVPDGI